MGEAWSGQGSGGGARPPQRSICWAVHLFAAAGQPSSPGAQILAGGLGPLGQAGRACAGRDPGSGGSGLSVARGLPTLPWVRHSMHAGPVLGNGLDHVQEEGPLAPLLAPVLEPLLNLLEGRGGRPVTEGTGPKQGAEDPTPDRSGGAGLGKDREVLDAASSAGRGVGGPHSTGPRAEARLQGGRRSPWPRLEGPKTQPHFCPGLRTQCDPRGVQGFSGEGGGRGGLGCEGLESKASRRQSLGPLGPQVLHA